jgi:DNA-binding protein YbaB
MFPEGDMSALLAQAQAMQQQLIDAQEELANSRFDGTAGGDLVTATVTGSGELGECRVERSQSEQKGENYREADHAG